MDHTIMPLMEGNSGWGELWMEETEWFQYAAKVHKHPKQVWEWDGKNYACMQKHIPMNYVDVIAMDF